MKIWKDKGSLPISFGKLIFIKRFFIIKQNSKQLSSLTNDVKLRIHVIDQLGTDFVMAKITAISSVANTINKFRIQSNVHWIKKKDSYYDKEG